MIENEKQKIKKNIGYLFSNLNGIFFRHLRNIFHYNELNMKILFIEENKNKLDNIFINENNIKKSDIIFYNTNNLLSIINSFDIIITCSNVDITSYFGFKNFNENIIKNIKPILIYIHHGLIEFFNINDYKIKHENDYTIWKNRILDMNKYNIKFITCCNNLNNLLDELNYNKLNKFKINSLPQFDLNKHIFNNFSKYSESILIVVGETQYLNINNIENLINILQNSYPSKKINLKFKFRNNGTINCKSNIEKKKYKNVNFYFEEKYLFEFINSFLIIITSGGTSFMETLMYNKKVILFQPNKGLDQFHKYPFNLNKLFIINDFNSFKKTLNLLLENKEYFNKQYDNEINKIINFHIGNKVTKFKDDFIKIINSL